MAASQGIYDNPPTWIPYISNRDCSQGICSLNCPQFCYFVLPPPPPVDFAGEVNSSPFNFSPLVIAIIGILASAILLVSYYTLISKYCRNSSSQPRADSGGVSRASGGISGRERWFFGPNAGLEETVIQSIAVVKYKKGFGSIAATSCSVCLSEFEEGETVRLLPKCTHPFHVPCIDTWLRSHPSCPLCRSDIVFPMLPPAEKLETSTPPSTSSSPAAAVEQGAAAEVSGERSSDDVIIEVGEEGGLRPMRRSFSTGHWCQTVADVMREDEDDDVADRLGDSKTAEICKSGGHREVRVLDSGKCATMKRSFSSGRLTISRLGRPKESRV